MALTLTLVSALVRAAPAALGLILLYLLTNTFFLGRPRKSRLPLPPGPPGEFLLGHLRIIPTDNPEYAYAQWSREYDSDILSFHILGQPIIVLNSVVAASALLDRQGANFADRPRFVLFEEMGWGKTLTFLRHGPAFKMHRKILQRAFQKSAIPAYRPVQERETATLLQTLATAPDTWEVALRRLATAVVLSAGFGLPLTSTSSPWIQIAADASYALGHGGAPAGTPVDYFPLLRFLPRVLHDRSLKFARDWRWAIEAIHNAPYAAVAGLAAEDRAPSLITSLLAERQRQLQDGGSGDEPLLTEDDIKGAAGAVYAAGQDTTWSTLVVFMLAMVRDPAIQRRAQEELDRVVGRDRLPGFGDRAQLPYIEYILQETLRWIPVSPVGVPHRALAETQYAGYTIPAGAYVYANARAMTHDAAVYADPETFNPGRYAPVSEGGGGEPFPTGQFGFGRRVCVGRHMAEATVWLVMAGMLSTMWIGRKTDSNGEEIVPEVEVTNGLTSHPTHFKCAIRVRDEQARAVVMQAEGHPE